MKQYLEMLDTVQRKGKRKPNRTGIDTFSYSGMTFRHDMNEGFPLITTKSMATKAIAVELEGFINGITDKRWYQERTCKIWNEWCNKNSFEYAQNLDLLGNEKEAAIKTNSLGDIYGKQWRDFNGTTFNKGVDQLKNIINSLKKDPYNRKLVCSAWNPQQLESMALEPCHVLWHVLSDGVTLDLCWFQRSCDMFLGIPFNIASYGILLTLIAQTVGLKPGILTGFLHDCHIYTNHVEQVTTQLSRNPHPLPTIEIKSTDIFSWTHQDLKFNNYIHHPKLTAPVAV